MANWPPFTILEDEYRREKMKEIVKKLEEGPYVPIERVKLPNNSHKFRRQNGALSAVRVR